MLCRRCGMESSTTDVCEWCSRSMLPAGATVSGKAAKELKADGTAVAAFPQEAPEEPAGLPLAMSEPEEAPEETVTTTAGHDDVVLEPLGGHAPTAPALTGRPTPPSHGLGDSAMQTSIDLSLYLGKDQSIFRPVVREGEHNTSGSMDRLAQKAKFSERSNMVSDIPENTRLMRSVIAGITITTFVSIVQFIVTKKAASAVYFAGMTLTLSRGTGFLTALVYGVVAGLLFGFLLGAALVRLRKGSFIGAVVGFIVGIGLQNAPYAQIAGALTGIVVGRFATVGLRRVVNL